MDELAKHLPMVNFVVLVLIPVVLWVSMARFWASADSRYVRLSHCALREASAKLLVTVTETDMKQLRSNAEAITRRLNDVAERLSAVEATLQGLKNGIAEDRRRDRNRT